MRMEFRSGRIVGSYSRLRFAGSLMSSGPHAGTLQGAALALAKHVLVPGIPEAAETVAVARDLVELGFRLVATHGTAAILREAGLEVEGVLHTPMALGPAQEEAKRCLRCDLEWLERKELSIPEPETV